MDPGAGAYILSTIQTWGYGIILVLSIVEGPLVAIVAGFLVSTGELHWLTAFLVLMLGDFVGDALYYYVGYVGHGPVVERIARRIGVTDARMRALEQAFKKHDWKILLINKTQAIGSVVLYYGGAARMNFWRFQWINTIGSIPKVALFQIVGFYFGTGLSQLQTYLTWTACATLLIPLGLLAAYGAFVWYGRRSDKKEGLL